MNTLSHIDCGGRDIKCVVGGLEGNLLLSYMEILRIEVPKFQGVVHSRGEKLIACRAYFQTVYLARMSGEVSTIRVIV